MGCGGCKAATGKGTKKTNTIASTMLRLTTNLLLITIVRRLGRIYAYSLERLKFWWGWLACEFGSDGVQIYDGFESLLVLAFHEMLMLSNIEAKESGACQRTETACASSGPARGALYPITRT